MGKAALVKWYNEENNNPSPSVVKEPLVQLCQGASPYSGFIHLCWLPFAHV